MNGMSRKKLLGIADKILILPSRDRLFVYSWIRSTGKEYESVYGVIDN